ncbi:topoisomerase II [Botrimarina mediterranea]|uniref:DUF559 domain-containing protein n=1 Tax=Botrimarina mediterranea TaxID=2528022 RepID=A0A518K266_9BACT|nr:topoisomerase II [Botrimarina mediterranea]QDV71859.1 hypothetical protein Spa11_00280 [Botrimarina mediterranea]
MPRRKSALQQKIDELTKKLASMREEALKRAGYKEFGTSQVASFHGIIGGKNNTYVDAIREIFLSPSQFIAEWKEGALEEAESRDARDRETYGRLYQNAAVHRIIRLLKDPLVNSYVETFLERNFCRQYHARTRVKPEDALWELWFGAKNQEYGLFITPRYDEIWENDVSEIRRVSFDYWTIEHVLTSGLIVPKKKRIHKIKDLDHLFDLYQDVFIRSTGSSYSKAFGHRYEEYVREQKFPLAVPFMIPEFRYEGASTSHKYRLDFTILSANRGCKVGIELSPWSTHGRVLAKKKLQASGGESAVEKERIRKWEADTTKRNSYFKQYGITTLTFTNSDLKNIHECFANVVEYLQSTGSKRRALPDVQSRIVGYKLGS